MIRIFLTFFIVFWIRVVVGGGAILSPDRWCHGDRSARLLSCGKGTGTEPALSSPAFGFVCFGVSFCYSVCIPNPQLINPRTDNEMVATPNFAHQKI